MAFKLAASLLVLGASMFVHPVLAGEDLVDCTEVDFATFNVLGSPTDAPRIGVKGMYAPTNDGGCVYVDASPGSTFSQAHPDEYASFIRAATKAQDVVGLEFLSTKTEPDVDGLDKRANKCGSICSGGEKCSSCSCKLDQTVCELQACWTIYKCK
ncbi:hypothetical protein FQN50_007524 [Emmonsiellopsis sp. PD_5]|nr:hypothetical protein FQN50_007524 [Emmonsiellopsis sp. PD_5]